MVNCNNARLNEFCKLLFEEKLTEKCHKELIAFATENHFIRNDIYYTYSNERAILQGGTSLIVGLGYENGKLTRERPVSIDNLIVEKILIPKSMKQDLLGILNQYGYESDILYTQIEKLNGNKTFKTSILDVKIENRISFTKIIGKYQINTITPDADTLIKTIDNLYLYYYNKYGKKSRIWLYFCHDKNDESSGNWICRTCWKENEPYRIVWNKNYLQNRVMKLNEEFSFEKVCEELVPIINQAFELLQVVSDTSKENIECVKDVITKKQFIASVFISKINRHTLLFC